MKREFKPMIIETKEQLLVALKNGKLKSSKYNLLNEEEKLFVEMIVFGDYSAEQAMRAIRPKEKINFRMAANRMLANPDVAGTLEELSIQKDKKFMAEISSARDLALKRLTYIMSTTKDEAVAAACAKTILDKAEKIIQHSAKDDSAVTGITFQIQVDNIYDKPTTDFNKEDAVVIPVPSDQEHIIEEQEAADSQINPDTGLNYILSYESVDNYNDDDD